MCVPGSIHISGPVVSRGVKLVMRGSGVEADALRVLEVLGCE
jgi:hypothetical protein